MKKLLLKNKGIGCALFALLLLLGIAGCARVSKAGTLTNTWSGAWQTNVWNYITATNSLVTFTNETMATYYNGKLTISEGFNKRLFVGTNEFRIVRTTNVVITLEPVSKAEDRNPKQENE